MMNGLLNEIQQLTDLAPLWQSVRGLEDISLSRDLSSLGIKTREDLEIIVTHGFNPQRVKNNPRLVTQDALRDMLCELQCTPLS